MARRDQEGTQDSPLLVSFFLLSSSSSMFNLLICIILKTKYILSLNSSFHLPISWCLLSTPKNIKVGPIIRIILVPPLSSVNLRRERSQRGSGLGAWAPSVRNQSPLSPQMKWNFLQGSMESRQFESRSGPRPRWHPLILKRLATPQLMRKIKTSLSLNMDIRDN